MEREYIVTAKTKEDLASLYEDLETLGGCECIPSREVQCAHRRPISRNTHYYLTDEEAALIRNDERVMNVELSFEERGLSFQPSYTIEANATEEEISIGENEPNYTLDTSFWSKSINNSDAHRQWGMYRCVNGATVSNWGNNGTQSIPGTVLFTSTGKNVDVVVVDGCFDPNHPEFAVNEAGTGGSRVNQFNWFSLNPEVTGGNAGTYLYVNAGGTYTNGSVDQQNDNNHGCHVAGTVAGNRRGWAREANIYNINPYSTAPSVIDNNLMIDYIRAWHNSKAVNPTTGFRNPTITNHSYGVSYSLPVSDIISVTYRGTTYNSPTTAQLTSFGLLNNGSTVSLMPISSIAYEQDIIDAVADGIIWVGAAGNSSFKIDNPGGADYDNSVYFNYLFEGTTYQLREYYHRGSTPNQVYSAICVGNIDANVIEEKATSSNCGPRIDIYAPGTNIVSSIHNNQTGSNDSRNASYRVAKKNGTSMASPNVAGVLACLAEQFPRLTQAEAKAYLGAGNTWASYPLSKQSQLSNIGNATTTYNVTNNGASDYTFSGSATGNDPAITVTEGTVMTFNVNAPGHPFWIKTTNTTGTGSGVTSGIITNNGTESGTIIWNTRGVTPGTYYYICQFHSSMVGTITISSDHGNTRSLQGSRDNYLLSPRVRKVPNPTGTTYIGGETTSQITFPKEHKFRSIMYDLNAGFLGDQQYAVDEDIYQSGFVYPRRPIWHRSLT